MNILPTVGRSLYFYKDRGQTEPWAAKVCGVNADGTLTLAVCDAEGSHRREGNVQLVQPGEDLPDAGVYCVWMPWTVRQEELRRRQLESAQATHPPAESPPVEPKVADHAPHHKGGKK